jgi:hypothetical protein
MSEIEWESEYGRGYKEELRVFKKAIERFIEGRIFSVAKQIEHHEKTYHDSPKPDGVYVKPGDALLYAFSPTELVIAEAGSAISSYSILVTRHHEGEIRENWEATKDMLTTRDGKRVLGVRECKTIKVERCG